MPRCRSFLFLQLPLLTVAGFLLSGALAQQNTAPKQTAPSAVPAPKPASTTAVLPPKPDTNANTALKNAIDALDPKKIALLQTKLWEQVDTLGLTFQTEGMYWSGPQNRMRLEMKVRVGNTESSLLVVSDGSWVWNELKLPKDEVRVSKYDLREIQKQLNAPNTMPTFVEDFYKNQSFRGLAPLLESLSPQMTFTKHETTTWKGQPAYKLTAVWNADIAKQISPAGQPWPGYTVRTCYLYLAGDKSTPAYWPLRVEWWGPGQSTTDQLLMAMEFRDPVVIPAGRELPKEYSAKFFYEPGKANVINQTGQLVDGIKQVRNSQSQQRPASAPGK
ncbi:MAG TPA: hypothetical protein VGY58_10470 [Gemmataceae bacterium]|jgi:hypothetical protein|nr:hypothetical protein [Gemmataceae bacterium]